MSEWLSWRPFWRQEKRLERLIAEADANPKDAAKQRALLAELNKHRFGWMAREVDFNGVDAVGEYFKRNGKVLTVSEVESEEARENGRMVALLASQIKVKNQHLLDLECRYNLSQFVAEEDLG